MQLSFGNEPVLYVAGYQGRDLAAFVRLVHKHHIVQLVDIREKPVSMRPGFGKSSLIKALAEVGAGYVHVPEADNPFRHHEGEWRQRLARYASHLDAHPEIVERVGALVRDKTSVLLTFEREAKRSHRGVLGARVGAKLSLPIVEL